MIPASYVFNGVGYTLFGWDERGSRVISALAGTALVGVVALLGALTLGRRVAMVLATLTAVSPAHIFQSQTNRFYSLAALFAGIAILTGATSLKRSGVWWPIVTVMALVISVLTHTVTAALAAAVGLGMLLSRPRDSQPFPYAAAIGCGIAMMSIALWLVIYVRPLLAGWNEGVYAYAVDVFLVSR